MAHYPVELTIAFRGGTGVTRSVGREDVRFVTDHAPDAGRLIGGTLRTPDADDDGLAIRLRYRARVTAVRGRDDGTWEVEARFEDLGFAVPEPV